MKRGAHGDYFLKLIERIRATIPGVAIRTSMIVGFPGETQADFEILCQFVKAAQFDRLGVFSYSDEDTSASFHLDGKVDGTTIYNRKRSLMALQRHVSRARNRSLIGRRSGCARRRALRRDRPAVEGPNVHASARNRRRSATSTTLATLHRKRATSAACASPKHTITTWLALSRTLRRCRRPN